ncbi:unnamed protein product [Linum tenue]
MFTMS